MRMTIANNKKNVSKDCLASKKKAAELAAAIFICLSLLVTGCGANSSDTSETYAASDSAAYTGAMNKMSLGMANAAVEEAASADVYDESSYDGDSGYSGSSGSGTEPEAPVSEAELGAASAEEEGQETDISRKLIRTVNISAQTTDFDTVTASVDKTVSAYNGYIESSNIYGTGYDGSGSRYASYTIRIPADELDEFLKQALDGLHVVSRNENVEDITLKYTDLESKVKSLKVEQDRLYELLAKAENVDAIIQIETRLSDIRYELESIESSLRVYDNQVIYSTVYLNFDEVRLTSTAPEAGFTERIAAGLKQNLMELGDNIQNLLIAFISSLPTIIVCIVIIAVIVAIARKLVRRITKGKPIFRKKKASANEDVQQVLSPSDVDDKSKQ